MYCEDPLRPVFSVPKSEANEHYHMLSGFDRYWIQPAAIPKPADFGRSTVLVPVHSDLEKEIAAEFARYFHKETGFDSAPYDSVGQRPEYEQVFLIHSSDIAHGSLAFMVGAIGVELSADNVPVVTWVWIHPFARGGGSRSLALKAWTALEDRFGDVSVLAPVRKPMSRFLERNRPETKRVTLSWGS